jgi:hypothetical protein
VGVFTFPSFEFRVTLGRNTVSVFPFRGLIGSVLNGSATDPADFLILGGNLGPVIFGLRGFDEAGTLPRWTAENRQFVDRAKPAISGGRDP